MAVGKLLKKTGLVLLSAMLVITILFVGLGGKASAANGVTIHMNGGDGLTFTFYYVDSTGASVGPPIVIEGVQGQAKSDEITYLAPGDKLAYIDVMVTGTSRRIETIYPDQIGHRSDKNARITNDGSMGSNGVIESNIGDINFWFSGGRQVNPEIAAKKEVVSDEVGMSANEFKFALYSGDTPISGETPIAYSTNDVDGNILFSLPSPITAAGVYKYRMIEVGYNDGFTQQVDGMVFDPAVYIVTINVEKPSGTSDVFIVTSTNYAKVGGSQNIVLPLFSNTYSSVPPEPLTDTLTLTADKEVDGDGTLTNGQFEFAVIDNATGDTVATGTNDAYGKITFTDIHYTEDDVSDDYKYYTVKETSTDGDGWQVSKEEYIVRVFVGKSSIIMVYPTTPQLYLLVKYFKVDGSTRTEVDGMTFTNTYRAIQPPQPKNLNLTATKIAVGAPLTNGEFHFSVFDKDNNVVSTGTNNAAGIINFAPISFTDADVSGEPHTYTVKETGLGTDGWMSDQLSYQVDVLVQKTTPATGDPEALTLHTTYYKLDGTTRIEVDSMTFTNTFTTVLPPLTGNFTLTATKKAVGGSLTNGQFQFSILDKNGKVVSTGTNNAAGKVTFTPISFTDADVSTQPYTYTVKETSRGVDGWTVDSQNYQIDVLVQRDTSSTGADQLAFKTTCYTLDGTTKTKVKSITFTNTYTKPIVNPPTPTPNTTDNSLPLLALAGMALVGGAGAFGYRKNQRRKTDN